eukprot:125025_1
MAASSQSSHGQHASLPPVPQLILRSATQLPPPLWKPNQIADQTKSIAEKIRTRNIKYCKTFAECNSNYKKNTMRVISQPRLKRLIENNKLKADRLARKAHLARVSRRKKAQKLDELRNENQCLKMEVAKLKKQNQILNKLKRENIKMKSKTNKMRNNNNGCMDVDMGTKPVWMNEVLKSDETMKRRLNLNDEQMSFIQKSVNPDIALVEDNMRNSKIYTQRLQCNQQEKIMLQKQIHEKLQTILTTEQMSKLCKL